MLRRPYSTISIRKKNHKYNLINNNNNLNNYNNITPYNDNNIYQSPKIHSGKMRYILENKKLFSLLDLNEKITNSKGPSLPIQFKRLTSEEINDLFKGNFTKVYDKLKKLKFSSIKNNHLNRVKIPKAIKKDSYIFNKESTIIQKEEHNEINDTENNLEKFMAHTDQGINVKLNNKKEEILKRPNTSLHSYQKKLTRLNKKNLENNKENQNYKIDKWMPTNYKNYEQLVKDRKLFIQKMKENPFFNRLPTCTLKEIQSKVYNTDIFFVNPQNTNKNFNSYIYYKNNLIHKNNNCYYNSDIFNIKNDEISLDKIGEKYLFHIPQKIKYTSSRESKSEWHGHIQKDSINNCSSKEYNILIPNRKNNNLTKDKIYKTLDETNNSKDNPIHKQKSISNYIDLANNSSCNFGKDYTNCYNLNPNCFKKIPENCSSYGDLFLQYKDICDKPYYKQKYYYIE